MFKMNHLFAVGMSLLAMGLSASAESLHPDTFKPRKAAALEISVVKTVRVADAGHGWITLEANVEYSNACMSLVQGYFQTSQVSGGAFGSMEREVTLMSQPGDGACPANFDPIQVSVDLGSHYVGQGPSTMTLKVNGVSPTR